MQTFELVYIFDGKPKGFHSHYSTTFKADDIPTAIGLAVKEHTRGALKDHIDTLILQDDRGAVIYRHTQPTGAVDGAMPQKGGN